MGGFLVPLAVKEKVPEPLIVLKKDLSEKIAQKIGLEKERVPSSIKKMEAKVNRILYIILVVVSLEYVGTSLRCNKKTTDKYSLIPLTF